MRRKIVVFGPINQRGSAVIEFAIVLPVLTLLFLGFSDLSRVQFIAITLANAVRAGSIAAQQNAGSSLIIQAIIDDGKDISLTASNVSPPLTVCQCPDGSIPTPNSCSGICSGYGLPWRLVTVSASTTYDSLFDYPFLPKRIPIARSLTIRTQ